MQNRDFPLAPTPEPIQSPKTDSTGFYKKEVKNALNALSKTYDKPTPQPVISLASNRLAAANKNLQRQSLKNKPGYDAMGFPKKN
jgi:hypothetical protein